MIDTILLITSALDINCFNILDFTSRATIGARHYRATVPADNCPTTLADIKTFFTTIWTTGILIIQNNVPIDSS